jgi:hypothetical protein
MDMQFVMNEVLDYEKHYKALPCGEDASPDMVDAIMVECAKFCEEILAPLNQVGDEVGCKLEDGVVKTPPGFKEAYQQWQQGGWQGLSHPTEVGGQGLPMSLGLIKSEMAGTANWSWNMYPGLSLGAMNTLYAHGTDAQQQQYLPKLCDASWTGTMCLTEPHCGSDLAQLRTKAELNDDGSYAITGTKIFISSGDHDMAENIIHIVIARVPGSPEGTKGISLFIVPKILVDEQGELLETNAVNCASLEEKMGIHGNATAVLNFDGAKGFLLGTINNGMASMFTFMNTARLGTAIQGVAAAELSYQNALPYALERYSMRSLSGHKNPDKPADAIIHHPDVRRLLMTQKTIAEGGRAMLYDAAKTADIMVYGNSEEEKSEAENYLGFMTPILKAFLTEMGNECASHGMQVFGGHGYIAEHGMEQIYRDSRISTLYEGTTGIQAMDLLGRKVILDGFKLYRQFSKQFYGQGFKALLTGKNRRYGAKVIGTTLRWNWLTIKMLARASRNRDAVGAASYDFLMYGGYLSLSYYWSKMAEAASKGLEDNPDNKDFYEAKLASARFWFERMLPRAKAHAGTMDQSTDGIMGLSLEQFSAR